MFVPAFQLTCFLPRRSSSGSTSWISRSCTQVAYAAVYAANEARNWLRGRTDWGAAAPRYTAFGASLRPGRPAPPGGGGPPPPRRPSRRQGWGYTVLGGVWAPRESGGSPPAA